MDRRRIVATKAFTQTLGHTVKIVYYGLFVGHFLEGDIVEIPDWLYAAVVVLGILGARIGTRLLHRLDDKRFRRMTTGVVLTLGAVCILKGIADLLATP